MNYKEGLVVQIFRLLATIETPSNQPTIRRIEGLVNALRNEEDE